MSSRTIALGIDPGLSGGLALVDADTRFLLACTNMPTTTAGNGKTVLDGSALAAWIAGNTTYANADVHAFIELVSSRPRQAGQFNFGLNTGIAHGIAHALNIPLTLVVPVKWKQAYQIKRAENQTKADTKDEARAIASALWPEHAHAFKRVKDDGVAEAALIARYGAKQIRRNIFD